MMRGIAVIAWITMLFCVEVSAQEGAHKRWAVLYSHEVDTEELNPYSLVVLDNEVEHLIIERLRDKKKQSLGYLSLGEISKEKPYYETAKRKGLLLEENRYWPGSFMVDIRKPAWAAMVLEELVPQVLFKRFNGLFLDTVDNALYLEDKDPDKYAGMKEAAVRLIKAIRLHYPGTMLMLNRAYAILPSVADDINMELGEEVYSEYNFDKEKYALVPKDTYERQLKVLREAREINPFLEIYTLDYWNADDPGMIRRIYQIERENGFIPYVSTVDLQKVIPEP